MKRHIASTIQGGMKTGFDFLVYKSDYCWNHKLIATSLKIGSIQEKNERIESTKQDRNIIE
jgi:hypothetical protein